MHNNKFVLIKNCILSLKIVGLEITHLSNKSVYQKFLRTFLFFFCYPNI